jgi:hypothetical protein
MGGDGGTQDDLANQPSWDLTGVPDDADLAGLMPPPSADLAGADLTTPPLPPIDASCGSATPVTETASYPRDAGAAVGALTIPSGHPRLWLSGTRLDQAKTWWSSHSFTPSSDDPASLCFKYLMTGDSASANTAISYVKSTYFPLLANDAMRVANGDSSASDNARWIGEDAILTYDWCYGALSSSDKSAFVSALNQIMDAVDGASWGGAGGGFDENNYFWGYLRDDLEWGITSMNDNANAQKYLDDALQTRWAADFLSFAAGAGRGGAPEEGNQYGRYLLRYSVVPFVSANLLGRDLYNQTDFFQSAIYYLIYSTSPAVTTHGTTNSGFEVFPFSDDEMWRDGKSAEASDYGDFMSAMSAYYGASPHGQFARQWLSQVKPDTTKYIAAFDPGGTATDFSNLPLDFYAPGHSFFFTRNKWGGDATSIFLKLDQPGSAHPHADAGSFQLWRKGRFLSRESDAYGGSGETVVGYNGSGSVDANSAIAHNLPLVNGAGPELYSSGGKTLRLESRRDYSYAVVDLTSVFSGNASAKTVVREYLFVRALEALVVLDRIESKGGTAATVKKTFLAHFETTPTIEDNAHVRETNGDQVLRVTTLLPQSPATPRVVTEGGPIGQYRLEIDASGTAQSYLLHVLAARGTSDPDLTTSLTEDATRYTVTLQHPTKGSAVMVFAKGMSSTGGTFTLVGSSCTTAALIDGTQAMNVTASGPVWGP